MDRETYDAAMAVAIELYEKVKEAVAIVEQAKEGPG